MEQKVQQYDTPPPNYSLRQHATHGFSHRPSIAQIASYLIIIFTIVIYFSCTIILNTSTPLLIISCLSLTSLIISTAIATCTDPTDRVVYYYKWSRHDKKITFAPQYDKILYCEYCDSYCWATSKHCRTCNRCVSNFDHHCMWFNNCVGKRNYTAFMVSIVSTFVFSAVVSVHVVVSSTGVEYGVKEQLGKIIPSWIAALLMTIFGFLLFNLIVLHIYLIVNGMTTYQFLQKRKKEQEEEKKKKQQMDKGRQKERKNMLPPLVITGKNKVMPSHSLPQLDSIQAIDSKAVKMKEEVRSEIVQSQHESSHVKLDDLRHEQIREEVKNSNTVFVGSDSASINSRSSEYKQNIIESQHSENDMNRSLPRFFRQNRSLKFLLSNQGQSPRKRQPQTDHFLPHQE